MELLIGFLILSTGLGILLSGSAGKIWQEKGGSFWVGTALSIFLGVPGFLWVVYRSPRP